MNLYIVERRTYGRTSCPRYYKLASMAFTETLGDIQHWMTTPGAKLDYKKECDGKHGYVHKWTVRAEETGEQWYSAKIYSYWANEDDPRERMYPKELVDLAEQFTFNE